MPFDPNPVPAGGVPAPTDPCSNTAVTPQKTCSSGGGGGGGGDASAANQVIGNASVASIDTKTPAQGQATMANSSPVVIASNQSSFPVTVAAGSAVIGHVITDTGSTTAVTGTVAVSAAALPLPLGAATAALQTQPGVDIGDVTVNNAAGAAAVNIQDGGNAITVDYATTGSGTATGALRVELPTNGTGVIATVGAVTAITNALPAGTNAIGKLVANSGVDIGDVTLTSNVGVNIGTVGLIAGTANVGFTNKRVTYSASISNLVPAAGATDIFEIQGGATSVRINRIVIYTNGSTAVVYFKILKRSTYNTGGTSTQLALVPHSTASSASAAHVKAYTANPATLGTLIGQVRSGRAAILDNGQLPVIPLEFTFGSGNNEATELILDVGSDCLCVNLDGQTIGSGLIDIYCEWTEIP